MRKTLLLFMLLSVKLTFGQISDDFSDGDFSANPSWVGQTTLFNVNSSKQLQTSLVTVAQSVSLVTANAFALNTKWEFTVQMNFDPSATNRARIYLISDQQDLNGALNGYFVQIGESGSTDSYDLYKQTGTSITRIIDGPAKTRTNVNALLARIRVTRNDIGKWELLTDISGGNNFVSEGTVTDLSYINTNWFGVRCDYTATRSNGFTFDDFSISELTPDITPPILLSAKALNEFTIEAVFSERLESTSAMLSSNYVLSQLGNPIAVATTSLANVYQLTFATTLFTGAYTLTVNNVKDVKGNLISANSTADLFYIKPYLAKAGDVVINEIFADPSPQIGLPNAEFVELWNTTDEYILLTGWKYKDLTTTYTFTADTLKPKQYLILCANADVNLFSAYGKTKGLTSWPTLNNDKDVLKLLNENDNVIDEAAYNLDWYKDPIKAQGGYSLELIDPKNKCKGIQNWMASTATSGGTPDLQNSVYQNQISTEAPKLLTATIVDEQNITLQFSKYVDSLSASKLINYVVNNGIGNPIAASPIGPLFTTVNLKFVAPFVKGIENLLTVSNLVDCAGNLIHPSANSAKLFMAEKIKQGDILISEVLFNPREGSVDFVEIYNNSGHTLDLKELKLANLNSADSISNIKIVSSIPQLMPANSYWVLTSNVADIKQQYNVQHPNQIIQLGALPAFNNDKGNVILLTDNFIVDRFDYHEGMHHALLKNFDGVSLERISFASPTNAPNNFKSAAQSVGFATPTARNSQETNSNTIKNNVTLANKTFSPDGDGFEDLLQINYEFVNNENLATINIYTDRGILVRKLQRNTSLATTGSFIWDGLDDLGKQSKVGIYIIKFDAFALNGKAESFKQTCVLASRLN
jgi:hypothetical protein